MTPWGSPAAADDAVVAPDPLYDAGDGAGIYSPYQTFRRAEWSALSGKIPVPLTPEELARLQGINEELSMAEVADIYLPLARLLNLHVAAAQHLHRVSETFLESPPVKVPY